MKREKNIEYRISINDCRSEEKGNIEYRMRNKEFESSSEADSPVFDSLPDSYRVLISYLLFLMWLKPNVKIIISARQLKQTAKDSEKSNFSAISFAVDFSQRIATNTPDSGLQPHDITMWLKPLSLISTIPLAEANGNIKISTVYHIKKPSATETWFPAEGCISESQAN